MDNKTLVMLVVTNNPELIVRAVEIENGMWEDKPTQIVADVHRNHWTEEQKENETSQKYYREMTLDVIAINPFKIREPYLVRYPNGDIGWVNKKEIVPQ